MYGFTTCSDTQLMIFIQYPISENGFEFQELLVETLYGLSVWDRLRSLVNLLKMISEQNNSPANTRKKSRWSDTEEFSWDL